MPYNLFLDDERLPRNVSWCALPSNHDSHWVIVRNYDAFVNTVQDLGLPDFVTFDHDLAEEHYMEGFAGIAPRNDYKEKTGYHCAEWLIGFCEAIGAPFPEYAVHSMNPVGRENIHRAIRNYKERRNVN